MLLKTPKQSELLLLAAGFASLIFLIFFKNHYQSNDEIPYLTNVSLLHHYGLGKEFLVRLEGSAGPLYAVVHYVFEPFTGLQPPGIRLVNVLFLAGTICFTALILKKTTTAHWTLALYLLAIPKIYVLTGLAFTELPAIFFFTAAVFFVLRTADKQNSFPIKLANAIVAGICLSLAILGRQPFLVALLAVPVLFVHDRSVRSVLLIMIIALITLALPVYVLVQWDGWMPPSDRKYYPDVAGQLNLRPDFFVLCVFYVAAAFAFIAPSFFAAGKKDWWRWLAVWAVASALNVIFQWVSYLPAANFLSGFLNEALQPASLFFGCVFICTSLYFLYRLFQTLLQNRANLPMVFFIVSLLLVCLASMRITWGFSSRYSMHVAPLIILIAASYFTYHRMGFLRIAAGVALGLLSLYSYYG